jgi:nucleoside 2-deoxyribosyltransferase
MNKFEFLDPMRRDYRGKETQPGISRQIVEFDVQDLKDSDIILVNAMKPSWGTAMEMRAAFSEFRKPVITVCSNANPSPWLLEHSNFIVKTFEEAVNLLKGIHNSLNVTKVYLCGGINGLSDSDCKDWREYVKEELSK